MDRLGAGAELAGSAESPDQAPVCSNRGCRREAVWAVLWNNPKLHTPERRKIWTACDEHREHLSDFLRMRGFLRDVQPLSELGGGPEPASPETSPTSGGAAE